MRLASVLGAASLALAMFSSQAALAFDVQTLSGTNADGSANYSDPDAQFDNTTLGGVNSIPSSASGFKFGMGVGTGTPVQSFSSQGADNGWQQLAPIGRLTR